MLDWRHLLVLAWVGGSLAWAASLPPLLQDPAYHAFADARPFVGVPHFLNVASNAPFVIVGLLGLRATWRADAGASTRPWQIVFVGVLLVGPGSAWYHWHPDDASLAWDRLPITVGFMALFVALIAEFIDTRLARMALVPAMGAGIASIVWWQATGDLRPYVWVQFMPLGVVAMLPALYRSRFTHARWLWVALAFYAAAKVAEHFDADVFRLLEGVLSGHTMKHLLAAAGCQALVFMLRSRRRRPA